MAPPTRAGLPGCWWSLTTHQLSEGDPLLTREEDVEIRALKERGWTISAIARHTGRDPKTIRSYLNGTTAPGVCKRSVPDPFDMFVAHVLRPHTSTSVFGTDVCPRSRP
nr:helix-turn-helix domain-containing protein [Nocardia sp. 348MFTsu5.1]